MCINILFRVAHDFYKIHRTNITVNYENIETFMCFRKTYAINLTFDCSTSRASVSCYIVETHPSRLVLVQYSRVTCESRNLLKLQQMRENIARELVAQIAAVVQNYETPNFTFTL